MKMLIGASILCVVFLGGSGYAVTKIADKQVDKKLLVAQAEFEKQTESKIEKKKIADEKEAEKAIQKEVKDLGLPTAQGQSVAKYSSEYNESWNVSAKDYGKTKNLSLLLGENDGGYLAGSGSTIFGLTLGQVTYQETIKKFGKTLNSIEKNHTVYEFHINENPEQLLYYIEGYYVTLFFDIHNQNKLRSVHYIKKNVELNKEGFYAQPSPQLQQSFEQMMVVLMNQSRVEARLKPFVYDKGLTKTARKHSQDMIDKSFFSHTGSNNSTPKSRMELSGYNEQMYAENIAYGQYSSVYAHEALMNSLGHRENILNAELTHVGVGVEFDKNNIPYYTINFYTPF